MVELLLIISSSTKDTDMTDKIEKPLPDLKTFIDNVNKKDTVRNGKKIRFGFTKRKRKG